jgi:hypothetical protein
MKKLLLLTIALLALGAATAIADSMNLGYACRVSTNNTLATTNDFSPVAAAAAAGGTCDDGISYTATKGFIASFKTTTDMPNWGGTHILLTVQTNTPMPDFWNVAAGGCASRLGTVSCPNTVVSGGANCVNMFVATPTDNQSDNNAVTVDAASGRVVVNSFHVRNTTTVLLAANSNLGGYLANNVRVAPDGADVCAGCDAPACVTLDQVEYFSASDNRTITTPELRAFLTWNGGTVNCPGSTPTKNSTWGRVKALYR